MIREFEHVWVETRSGFRCYINKTDYIPWPKTDLDGTPYTLAGMIAADAAKMENFGWCLYDQEAANVITGWKEF